MATIGERIREARRRARNADGKRMTQADLAGTIGVQAMQVSRWERGEQQPRSEHVAELAQALRCDANWLLTGAEPDAPAHATAESPPGYHEFVEHFGHLFDDDLVQSLAGDAFGRYGIRPEDVSAKAYLELAQVLERARGK